MPDAENYEVLEKPANTWLGRWEKRVIVRP